MKSHDWHYYKDIDAGHMGTYDIWECLVCGAIDSAIFATSNPPRAGHAFMPGSAMPLSDDCDVALLQISSFLRGQKMAHIRWAGPAHQLPTFAQCECAGGKFLEWRADKGVVIIACPHCAGTGIRRSDCRCSYGARRCKTP